ncbi:MAG: polymerase [Bacteroidales bacterium]|uniref:O-antigen ligase family protein n=1 Tax=Porphyromonas sp. TaxID=1924944 RepID=UPI002A81390D|nr:polymerase [Porphyromonas sp.]MDD6928693.1 polymerase [Bacteroidales bacterium]MDY4246054.1 polymerase [Porphyromonas sp.]
MTRTTSRRWSTHHDATTYLYSTLMPSHTAITRERALASRLARFVSRYFLLIVVAVALVVALVVALTGAYPHRTPETLLARDILTYQPLLLTVAVLLSIVAVLLPWLEAKGAPPATGAKLDYRHHFVPLLCFGLGYANLLLGVVDSYLGLQTLFLIGMIVDNRWEERASLCRPLRQRIVFPLALTAALYILYTAVVAVGWSANKEIAIDYWSHEVWLLAIPLYFLIYSGPSERLTQSFWQAVLRIAWVYLVVFLIFYYSVLISCGTSPLITLTLNKGYLSEAGFVTDSSHMLMPFTFTHYTYLGVYLLIPVVMSICSRERTLRLHAYAVLLAIVLYGYALQARYLLLMAVAVGGYALLYQITARIQGAKHTGRLAAYAILSGALLLTLVYTTSPYLMHGYFDGTVRNDALLASYQAVQEVPILIGGGLDYAYTLLQTLPFGTAEEPHLFHFHNQYMQTLVQSGIVGLMLWLSLLGSMLWIARKRHHSALIVVISLWIILCNVDLVSYLPEYLIGMLFLLCLALSTANSPSDPL